MPHLERPNLQTPNIHIPPQFIPHTPAQMRKYQPPFILIGAVIIGLTLVALLWLAVDNFVPGKPISTWLALNGTASGANAAWTPKAPRPDLVAGQNVDNLLRVGDDLARKSQFEPAMAQYQSAAKYAPNNADVYTHWANRWH